MSETLENKDKQPASKLTTPTATTTKESSALKLADKSAALLPGNRPVEANHLQIVHTYTSVGSIRPVTKSNLDIKSMMTLSGNRPITASHLQISQEFKIMGNRPVASNHIDDPLLLMGYLD
ncbi:hypothetical protein [Cyanobacterium aponinum]|uniref:hypothetical protein n=1 Tax=Cyanobacterium aponinum TaxID=379064 RepID=UPI000C12AA50|nr:hypothetical protein [Cyanobacterium aponinum]PHV64373.1 hypothetical protein CSQ80_00700 [Cyanobacterium aponinum IPPAS B-1201]